MFFKKWIFKKIFLFKFLNLKTPFFIFWVLGRDPGGGGFPGERGHVYRFPHGEPGQGGARRRPGGPLVFPGAPGRGRPGGFFFGSQGVGGVPPPGGHKPRFFLKNFFWGPAPPFSRGGSPRGREKGEIGDGPRLTPKGGGTGDERKRGGPNPKKRGRPPPGGFSGGKGGGGGEKPIFGEPGEVGAEAGRRTEGAGGGEKFLGPGGGRGGVRRALFTARRQGGKRKTRVFGATQIARGKGGPGEGNPREISPPIDYPGARRHDRGPGGREREWENGEITK